MPQSNKTIFIVISIVAIVSLAVVVGNAKRISKLSSKINPPNAVPNAAKSIVKEESIINTATNKVKGVFTSPEKDAYGNLFDANENLYKDEEGNRYTAKGEQVINYDANTGSYQLANAIWYNALGEPFKYYSQNYQAYLGNDDQWYTFTGIMLPYFNPSSGIYMWVDNQYYTADGQLLAFYDEQTGTYALADNPNQLYDMYNQPINE